MRRGFLAAWIVVTGIVVGDCSGSGGGGTSPSPAPTPAPAAIATVTVNIDNSNGLANKGTLSFSPNPASITRGNMVVWKNNDSTMHHIVLDDGSLDSGDIAAGASSPAKPLNVNTATYHCTIHSTMVGSINVATVAPPAPPDDPGPGY